MLLVEVGIYAYHNFIGSFSVHPLIHGVSDIPFIAQSSVHPLVHGAVPAITLMAVILPEIRNDLLSKYLIILSQI